MRKIFYAGGVVLTGDHTGKAVMRLARALAQQGQSEVVEFPVVIEGGQIMDTHMLIGPSSQMYSMPVVGTQDEPNNVEVIAALEQRTRELQPGRPVWSAEMLSNAPDIDATMDALA